MTTRSALKTVIDNDGKEPIPKYMMNPYTGRSMRTDSNKNRKLLNLPPLPRKERNDKGKKRGPYKRKTDNGSEEAPKVKIAHDKESESMINDLLKENRPSESESSDDTEPDEPIAPEEGEEDYVDVDSMKSNIAGDYVMTKRMSDIKGITFPGDYTSMYRKIMLETRRSNSN